MDATHGGGRATAQLIASLAARHATAVLYLRCGKEHRADDILYERCEVIEDVSYATGAFAHGERWARLASLLRGRPSWAAFTTVPAFGARLGEIIQTWRPDVVQLEYHVMGQYLPAIGGSPAPRILNQHEPGGHAAREIWRSSSGLNRVFRYLDLLAWERFEKAVIRQVNAVVVFTERDRLSVNRYAPEVRVAQIPIGTMLPERPLNPLGEEPSSILFVGNYRHPPNVDAAQRLISKIFPVVRRTCPEATLYIVGDQVPPAIQKMATEHVVVTGRVDDVNPYLDRAAVVAVPLRMGGGMRVKVLEALAAGKALVSSPVAVHGLDLVNGDQVLLADSDEQFSDAIVRLLKDSRKRECLASRARTWACSCLGWEKSLAAYESLYETLLQSASPTATV
jgi:glycosyltransferase involved in cell wall biosynthesis